MGFALVYGGEHFVTDVLAGWLLALGGVAVVGALAGLLARTPRRRSPRGRATAVAVTAQAAGPR